MPEALTTVAIAKNTSYVFTFWFSFEYLGLRLMKRPRRGGWFYAGSHSLAGSQATATNCSTHIISLAPAGGPPPANGNFFLVL